MSRLSHVLDRVLSRLVPETEASACVPPDPWREEVDFDCSNSPCIASGKYRDCHYTCTGGVVCGSWHYIWI